VTGDPGLPDEDRILADLTDPDGMFGMPVEAATTLLALGDRDSIAGLLAAYGRRGAQRVVVSVAAGDWFRQAELVAAARDQLL
jgi:hypothetical protein